MSDQYTERGQQNLAEMDFEEEMNAEQNKQEVRLPFPKYQFSMFTGVNKDQQIVIRSNDVHEFLKEVARFKETILKLESKPTTQLPEAQPATEAPKCGIHGNPMSWKTGTYKNTTTWHNAGEPYAFWSCSTKNADGSFCKYKPAQNTH